MYSCILSAVRFEIPANLLGSWISCLIQARKAMGDFGVPLAIFIMVLVATVGVPHVYTQVSNIGTYIRKKPCLGLFFFLNNNTNSAAVGLEYYLGVRWVGGCEVVGEWPKLAKSTFWQTKHEEVTCNIFDVCLWQMFMQVESSVQHFRTELKKMSLY